MSRCKITNCMVDCSAKEAKRCIEIVTCHKCLSVSICEWAGCDGFNENGECLAVK